MQTLSERLQRATYFLNVGTARMSTVITILKDKDTEEVLRKTLGDALRDVTLAYDILKGDPNA